MAGQQTLRRRTTIPEKAYYQCLWCGDTKKASEFYSVSNAMMWKLSENKALVCKHCADAKYAEFEKLYGGHNAMGLMCHYLDLPFVPKAYQETISKSPDSIIEAYIKAISGSRYRGKTYLSTFLSGEVAQAEEDAKSEHENKWSKDDARNKRAVLDMLGSDPFKDFTEFDRRYLFSELVKYFDGDEDLIDDTYKLSQVIQIVINNGQIHRVDMEISRLDPRKEAEDIKQLNLIKKDLVASNDKIAKENEISVKNRSNKDVGKNTLTYLMRDLRQKDFAGAEENYYGQLVSAGTQWAIDMSNRSIIQNSMFDENDKNEIFLKQRELIQKLQRDNDELKEQLRLERIGEEDG